ncbi:hypothetical protein [Roseibium sp.]|uniref:hypothetical protein n=1 Tax=Roseibium sp. TaxID=1936156 RepID=UPI003BADB148
MSEKLWERPDPLPFGRFAGNGDVSRTAVSPRPANTVGTGRQTRPAKGTVTMRMPAFTTGIAADKNDCHDIDLRDSPEN